GGIPERLSVRQQQIESAIVRGLGFERAEVVAWTGCVAEISRDEAAARGCLGRCPHEIAKIRDDAEAAAAIDAQPGAARAQIPSGQDVTGRGPAPEGCSGPLVVLIAIGGNHQAVARVCVPREHEQAHESAYESLPLREG